MPTARPAGAHGSRDLQAHLDEHLRVAQAFGQQALPAVERFAELVIEALARGNKLLAFGNGGSAADAQHLTTELLGHYRADRRALPAVALTTDSSALTGIGNDYAFDEIFARQASALVVAGDVAVGFSTSGESENVLRGLRAAGENGASTVALTGAAGRLAQAADLAIVVPSRATPRVQEVHVLVIHLICERIDEWATDRAERR
jgi:D-sedoheptulose 7-phosphate isomerase